MALVLGSACCGRRRPSPHPGLEISVIRDLPAGPNDGRIRRGERETDVIVIQRPLSRTLADAVPYLQARGIAVTVELDDDFLALHPEHPARQQLDEDTNPSHLVRACVAADLVTAPTQSLLDRYARTGARGVARNYLPRWTLDAPDRRNGRTIRLVWSGCRSSRRPGGRRQRVDVLRTAEHHVGPPDRVAERLRAGPARVGHRHASDGDYFNALSSIDVGIVPLGPTRFNAAKSPLKGLEWASAGSRLSPRLRLSTHGLQRKESARLRARLKRVEREAAVSCSQARRCVDS